MIQQTVVEALKLPAYALLGAAALCGLCALLVLWHDLDQWR